MDLSTTSTMTKQLENKPKLPLYWKWVVVLHALLSISLVFMANDTLLNISNIVLTVTVSSGVIGGMLYHRHRLFPWVFLSSGIILISLSIIIHSIQTFGVVMDSGIPFWIEKTGILLVAIFAFANMYLFERRFDLKGFTIDYSLLAVSIVFLVLLISPSLLYQFIYEISFPQQVLIIQILLGVLLMSMALIHHWLRKTFEFKDFVRITAILFLVMHFGLESLISFGFTDNIPFVSRLSWSFYQMAGSLAILFVFVENLELEYCNHSSNKLGSRLKWVAGILAIFVIPVGMTVREVLGFKSIDPIIIGVSGCFLGGIVIWRIIHLFLDFSAKRQQLASIAHTDALTGLPNYLGFLNKLVDMGQKNRLMIGINIEDFKSINDLHGREFGDEVLKSLARRLLGIRDMKIAARTGSDMFLVMCYADETRIQTILKNLKTELGVWDTIMDQRVTVPLTFGASHCKKPVPAEQQMRQVEKALKNARLQHTSFSCYSDCRTNKNIPRHELRKILQQAIDNNYLPIHFQPIYNLDDGSLKAMELLIRLQSKEHGVLLPGQFLEQAKAYGLLTPLTNICIKMLREYFDLLPKVTININLPPYMLDNPQLLNNFLDSFADSKLPPQRFCIEVTEDGEIPAENLIPVVKRLKDYGFSIAMDDFGTGYSTLSRLSSLSMDSVKIDRSLLLSAISGNKAVLECAIMLIKRLGVTAVVEGVETLEELALIRLLGADCVQGYLLSKPVHVSEAVNLSLNASDIVAEF